MKGADDSVSAAGAAVRRRQRQRQRQRQRTRREGRRLRVKVVESHQQVLPDVHLCLRQRRGRRATASPSPSPTMPAAAGVEGWDLVHFDSHADLACPVNVPARLCWRPHPDPTDDGDSDNDNDGAGGANGDDDADDDDADDDEDGAVAPWWSLYDHLEATPSGIAEWIVPLVLGARCERVTWIRPPPPPPAALPTHRTTGGLLHQAHSIRNASFPPGEHSFSVGAWLPPTESPPLVSSSSLPTPSFLDLPPQARVRVDSNLPYYADDEGEGDTKDSSRCLGCFAPTSELIFAQPVRLTVSYGNDDNAGDGDGDGDSNGDNEQEGTTQHRHVAACQDASGPPIAQPEMEDDDKMDEEQDWILDVCLDYFWCDNPFWHDLRQRNAGLAAALSLLACQSALYGNGTGGAVSDSSSTTAAAAASARTPSQQQEEHFFDRRRRVLQFRRALAQYLWAAANAAEEPSSSASSAARGSGTASSVHRTENDAPAALSCFRDALLPFYCDSLVGHVQQAMRAIKAALASIPDADDRAALVREGVQAIPYLTLPRDEGDPQQVVEARLKRFRQVLDSVASQSSLSAITTTTTRRRLAPRPMLITVARSAHDGFVSMQLANDIQGKVLGVLHQQYCACKSRRFAKVGGDEVTGQDRHQYVETSQGNHGPIRPDGSVAAEESCHECSLEIVLDYDQSDGDT
jgi:UPF0489 domain